MSFTRSDYLAVFEFARKQYFWHESTGRGMDLEAALVMHHCEEVIGQMSSFPKEARTRLAETPRKVRTNIWKGLTDV
jgi:hypothetical protein